jgi:hypothetical protein
VPGRDGLADEVAADAAGGCEDCELHLVVRSPRASASNSSTGQWSSVYFPWFAEWLAELVDASWVGNAGYRTTIGFLQMPGAEGECQLGPAARAS